MTSTITFQPFVPGTTDAGVVVGSVDPRLSRTNYFDGQLLTASDLTRDQIYVDERILELGQTLGDGVAWGLDLTLEEERYLRVKPGLAIAPSGRVLQLSNRDLLIDLQNSALIASLNRGLYRRVQRGLYAVTLQFAQVIDGTAEVYPADPTVARRMQVSSFAEGVELTLTALNIPLPQGDELSVRANLVKSLLANGSPITLPSDEAVPLGLLAVEHAKPLWLDLGLVRRVLRRPGTPDAAQRDLAIHYRELFQAVVAARQASGLQSAYPAAQYFRVLPPVGSLPKESIDPVAGSQSWFPPEYDVSIAPVRRADLPSLLDESMHLANMDLERLKDADIMVLVPLSDEDFALKARRLETPATNSGSVRTMLSRLDLLALRFSPLPPVHKLDTDAATWTSIWNDVDPDELVYVRRPPRSAETGVAGIVLAAGYLVPAAQPDPQTAPLALEQSLDAAHELLSQKEDRIIALEKLLAEAQKKEELVAKLDEARITIASLQDTLTKKDSLLTDTQNLLAKQNGELTQVQSELVTTKASLGTTIAALNTAQNDLATTRTSLSTTQGTLASTQKELAATKASLSTTLANLISTQSELATTKSALSTAQATLTSTQADLATTKSNLNAMQAVLTATQTDLAATRTGLSTTQATLASTQNELATTKAGLNTVQATLTAAQADLATTKAGLGATQATLTLTQNDLATTKNSLNTTQAALTSVQADLATTKSSLGTTQTALTMAQNDLTATKASLSSTQVTLSNTQTQLAQANTSITSLNAQVQTLNSNATQLHTQLTNAGLKPIVNIVAVKQILL
jgi:septal ring factor EnvC (AmiA/AmiB activator)